MTSSKGRNMSRRTLLAVTASVFAFNSMSVAWSVEMDSETTNIAFEEIVVTANKREQKLNDVGLAVAVLGGRALKAQKISSSAEIAQSVPGLSYAVTPNNTPVYTLRGIGFYETSLGAYPTVPVYIDEAPLSFPATTTHSAFDLSRIEVLKGPQGTLFGQNATGGAINYIATKPTDEFEAGLDVGYGRFNDVDVEGYVSGPLTDTLTARLSSRYERMDGWQVSSRRPNDRNGKQETIAARLLLDFQPTETARFQLNVNGWHDSGETQAPQYIATITQQVLDPDIAAAPFSNLTSRDADWTPGLPYKDNDMIQAVLRADIDLSDTITLTSLSSYVHFKQDQRDEGDGLTEQSLDLGLNVGEIDSYSQELRIANSGDAGFRWVLGANLERSYVEQEVKVLVDNSSTGYLFGQIGFPLFDETNYSADQDMTNYAFFGNVEYDVSEEFTLKGGIRYTKSKRDAELCSADALGLPGGVGDFFTQAIYGGAYTFGPGECYVFNDQGVTIGDVGPGEPGALVGSLNEDNVSWRVGVDWKATQDLLVYANVAKGYKAGSYPTVSATTFTQFLPVTQESVLSYELGFKTAIMNGALNFNGAAYYYDYKDKQLRSKLVAEPFGILDILQNIPVSSVKGFELELVGSPADGLVMSVSGTYTDAQIDEFTGINAAGLAAVFDNTRVPFTPKYQVSFVADYTFPVTDDLDAFVGTSVNYRSSTITIIGGDTVPDAVVASAVDNPFAIDSYTLVDVRAGIESNDEKWRISLYGKNIFGEYYWSNTVPAFDTIGRYTGMPATYGISLSYRY